MINEKYIDLFVAILTNCAATAEKAMEYNKEKNDLKAYGTSKSMREEFETLRDGIRDKRGEFEFTSKNCATLYIGAYLVAQALEKKIAQEQTVLKGYHEDIMPKLQAAAKDTSKIDEIFKLNS